MLLKNVIGHFTLWPLVEWTKDLSNMIGGEQKFVC
jgi:hypothetical protein